jgi:hypothetical protein
MRKRWWMLGLFGVLACGAASADVMMPVWMLNTRWKDKTYTFAMNGQTGKIVGNLPVDAGLAIKWGLGLFAGSFAVLFAVAYLLFAMGVM